VSSRALTFNELGEVRAREDARPPVFECIHVYET
jgi:hypothetical protein